MARAGLRGTTEGKVYSMPRAHLLNPSPHARSIGVHEGFTIAFPI
jgi:hypothetical protein